MRVLDFPTAADTAPATLGGPSTPPAPRRRRFKLPGPATGGLALVILALMAQWSVLGWAGAHLPAMFILPAVALAAALWGRTTGLTVLATCAVGIAPVLGRAPESAMPGGPLAVPLLLLVVVGGLMVELVARLRHQRHHARAAEERLMLAIERTGMGAFEVDLVQRRVHQSPGLARHLGLPAGPMPLEQWLTALPAPLLKLAQAHLADHASQRSASYEQVLHLPPFGPGSGPAPEWLLLRMQVDWNDAAPARLRGVCLDITARKRAEETLDATRLALQQQVGDLGMLHQLSSRLLDVDHLDAQLGLILQAISDSHAATGGLLAVLGENDGRLHLAATTGGIDPATSAQVLSAVSAPEAPLLIHPPAPGADARHTVDRIVIGDTAHPDTPGAWRALGDGLGVRAVHGVPLVSRGGMLLGVLVLLLPRPGAPGERECRLADICARKAAVFIERARAQAALAHEKDRFQAVLESSAVPFAVLAPVRDDPGQVIDFRWRFVNGAAARALGRPASALHGRRVLRELRARSGDLHDLRPYIDVVEQGQAQQMEIRLQLDDREGWVHCIASPVQGEVAVWFNDITDRKRDEALLRDAARRKDEFLAMLAHELRNPLAPIRQAAMLLRDPSADPERTRWCHAVIERQVAHMAVLLDDLLDVSRFTRGMLTLRHDDTTLQSVVDAAVETARPLIEGRDHRLLIDLPEAPLRLHADPLRLAQVLGNLLTNAARYTGRGGRIVLKGHVDGEGLRVCVQDNGMGIPADALGRVFELFSQLTPDGERAHGGLGIGLALSRALVELHGGQLSAHSDGPGRGSRFCMRLPSTVLHSGALDDHSQAQGRASDEAKAARSQADAGRAAEAEAPLGAPGTDGPAAATTTGLRILVADDNRDAAGSLAMLLQVQGHAVHQAFDGAQALALFERLGPEVCLLDIGMPKRDGYSVARAIRRMAGPQPMLIAVTGWGQAHDQQRALDAGFNHHLTKPVSIQRLLELVNEAVVR